MGAKGNATKKLDSEELSSTLFTVNSTKREAGENLQAARTILKKMGEDDTLANNQGEDIKEAAGYALKAVENIMENINMFANATNKLLEGYYLLAQKQEAKNKAEEIKGKANNIAPKS